MPGATLPNTGVVLPSLGGDPGTWDDENNANWSNYDAHDHSSGRGPRVKTAGISLDADLTFSGLYAPTNLHRLSFSAIAALSSNNKSLFVSSADNELYWRTNAGVNVKMTAGAALNVGAFTGGIGGDYTTVSAAVAFDDAGKRYTFKNGTAVGSSWARGVFGGVRLIEFNTTESVYVEHLAPAALAASYSVTWPLALPGSAVLMTLDASGNVAASNTITNAVTTSALLTASAGVTAAANQHFTVSGTGRFKHGDLILHVSPITGLGTGWSWDATNGYLLSSGAGTWSIGIPSLVGWRLKSLTFELWGDGAADLSGGVMIRHKAGTVATDLSIGATNPPASWNDNVNNFTDTTIVDGDTIYINLTANAANLRVGEIRVTYDFP